MFDLLIRGARVLDGTAAPVIRAGVGVSDGKIAELGDLRGRGAARAVDAFDLMLAPGFIDIHAHDDLNLNVDINTCSLLSACFFAIETGERHSVINPAFDSFRDHHHSESECCGRGSNVGYA